MKKLLYPLAFIMFVFSPTTYAYYQQSHEQQVDPVQYIKTALDKLENFSNNKNTASPMMLRNFIENEIIPHFSFDDMSRWITGPYAHRMTVDEKIDFQQRLKEAFLNSLSKHLGSFDTIKDRVRFSPTRYKGRNDAIVAIKVYRGDRFPARLDFRMRKIGKNWKIVDVRANGTSAVLYYRQHYIADLRQYRLR